MSSVSSIDESSHSPCEYCATLASTLAVQQAQIKQLQRLLNDEKSEDDDEIVMESIQWAGIHPYPTRSQEHSNFTAYNETYSDRVIALEEKVQDLEERLNKSKMNQVLVGVRTWVQTNTKLALATSAIAAVSVIMVNV